MTSLRSRLLPLLFETGGDMGVKAGHTKICTHSTTLQNPVSTVFGIIVVYIFIYIK